MTLTIENELRDLAKANLPEVLVEKINNWLSEDSKIKIKEALKKYFNFNKFRVQSVLSSDAWRRLTDNGNLPYLVATKDGDFYFRGAKGKLLCENNFNMCELGPRGTGKSYLYKEVSPNSILVSGGQTTVANLF